MFAPPPRTFQRTVYRPGEVCQFDLWEPRAEVPVGHGQTRRGWVVVACLGYSRAGAGALVFSKQTPDLLAGIARCLWSPRGAAADVGLGSPGRHPRPRWPPDRGVRRVLRAAEGRLAVLRAGDPQAKGVVERLQGFVETQLRAWPPRSRTSSTSKTSSTRWFEKRANVRMHKTLTLPAGRPAGRRAPADGAAARQMPDPDRRWVLRVPAGSLPALRHQRLLARSRPGRPARRGARRRRPR